MKLYFLRHATAADVAPSDAERPLTGEGREEARIAGRALAKLGAKPGQILTSPLLRARQTAELAAQELHYRDEVAVFDELRNGQHTRSLLAALRHFDGVREFLLVGHMPSLADHIAELLGAGNSANLSLGKGAVVCIETAQLLPGRGELRWFLRQKQLRLLA